MTAPARIASPFQIANDQHIDADRERRINELAQQLQCGAAENVRLQNELAIAL